MTTPMWQKSDELANFFPQPIFAEPPRPVAALNLPIFSEAPPDETDVEILSWDDIVSSEEEGEQFLAKISDYCSPVPMPADINMRFLVAYELLAEAKTVLGTREIRHWCDMSDRFDREITA